MRRPLWLEGLQFGRELVLSQFRLWTLDVVLISHCIGVQNLSPTTPLVNRDPPPLGAMVGRDNAKRRARRLAVQSDAGELWLRFEKRS